jgi:hypothetical protein
MTKHLVKIENNVITDAPQYFEAPDGTAHQDFNKSEELMTKYGFDYELTDDEYSLFKSGDGFIITDNKFVDIRNTDEYKKKIRLAEIETELTKADSDYTTVMDTAVEYTNGHHYKPSYIQSSYISLITANQFPLVIWDSTEIEANAVEFTLQELIALCMALKNVAEPAFQTRKMIRSALLTEKAELEG